MNLPNYAQDQFCPADYKAWVLEYLCGNTYHHIYLHTRADYADLYRALIHGPKWANHMAEDNYWLCELTGFEIVLGPMHGELGPNPRIPEPVRQALEAWRGGTMDISEYLYITEEKY